MATSSARGAVGLGDAPRTRRRVAAAAASRAYLGVDFGTSGARASVVDGAGVEVATARAAYDGGGRVAGAPAAWRAALRALCDDLGAELRESIASVAIDGTSATALLVDPGSGDVAAGPLMYDEAGSAAAAAAVAALAPEGHTVRAGTSTLVKLATWSLDGTLDASDAVLMHQADWLAYLLHGRAGVTDANNALKAGYDPDPAVEAWPGWLAGEAYAARLPQTVLAPGEPVANVSAAGAAEFGLPESCVVCAGTTDSIAAFIAAGAEAEGEAVTSLGSTMAVKLVSEKRVDHSAYGVYSHRLFGRWLVGGASNVGGACLATLFSSEELGELSARIDPSVASPLDYYPLPRPGERFPVADPALAPRLEPRPADDAEYVHGLLESIARVEARAYGLLAEMGATPVRRVLTAGGGSANDAWTAIRGRVLGVGVEASEHTEAAYGAALLARRHAA